MTIGLILNESKDAGLAVVRKLAAAIHARGGRAALTIAREHASNFRCPEDLLDLFEGDCGSQGGESRQGGCGSQGGYASQSGYGGQRGCGEPAGSGGQGGNSGQAGQGGYSGCGGQDGAGQTAFAMRSRCDALISVGGDGTLIKAARGAVSLGVPI
ncbi:MAG: hypothetical protein LBJ10_03265, partial [Clostridiales bacterium]|nr:hypothetical protein [Clostridiales bacterium]